VSGSRVVVTGGCGFIGGHLVEQLISRGDDVTIFDRTPPQQHQKLAREHARFLKGDVLNTAALRRAVTDGVDVVFHLAAIVGVDQYLARPVEVIDVDFTVTRNVLELVSAVGAKAVIASTSEVFGKNPAVPWREDDDRVLGSTAADRWAYSSSKALAEHLVFGFVRQRRVQATIVRYFNVYGGGQRPGFIVSRSVHRALNGRSLVVYDTGTQTRSFTFVQDAVRATLLAADHPAAVGEAFNIGSMTETTIGDTVELIADLTGPARVPIIHVDTQATLGQAFEDLGRRIPDNTKARMLLRWSPSTTLKDGLAQTIAWARDNPWWLDLPDSGA
jgi:nucleoside-diphosphate-sugar epimerase